MGYNEDLVDHLIADYKKAGIAGRHLGKGPAVEKQANDDLVPMIADRGFVARVQKPSGHDPDISIRMYKEDNPGR